MRKEISLVAIMAILIIGMTINVKAAACDANSCTPTCSWVYPSSDNYESLTNEGEGNTTMVAAVTEGTTSGFYNGTYWTITPYHNSTTTQNITGNSVAALSAVFDNLDDAAYTLSATIYYFNETTSISQNLTITEVACSDRQFIVDTSEGSIIPQIVDLAAEEDKGIKGNTLTLLLVALLAAYVIFYKKK